MQFAIAMTLVVLFSSIVLLYQYWTGAMVTDDAAATPPRDIRSDVRDETPIAAPARPFRRADHAA